MRGEELLRAMDLVREDFVEEAEDWTAPKGRRGAHRAALAACLGAALLGAGVLVFPPDRSPEPTPTPGATEEPLVIDMSRVYFNEVRYIGAAEQTDGTPVRKQSLSGDGQGADAPLSGGIPAYVPRGLSPAGGNGTVWVAESPDGEPVGSSVVYSYSTGEEAERFLDVEEWTAGTAGFAVEISRLGEQTVYEYAGGGEQKATEIGGTDVILGFWDLEDGPLYTAEFTMDDLDYKILARELEPREVVKVVASAVTGEEEVAVVP